MTSKLAGLFAILFFVAIADTATQAQDTESTGPIDENVVPGRYIVKFSGSANKDKLIAALQENGGEVVDRLPLIGAIVVQFPDANTEKILPMLKSIEDIEYAEPVYKVYAFLEPNDPHFHDGKQWGLLEIQAPRAWNRITDTDHIIVAVIDSGVDYRHPDLAANMWRNVNERPGDGLDNDGNGVIDDVFGADFSSAGLSKGDPMDQDGHGTHVAGIVGAVTNNQLGVAGTAWSTRILALKFMTNETGSTVNAIRAIDYAIKQHASVINASWGSQNNSLALQKAIEKAHDACIVFVAAAGNDGEDNDKSHFYPANYDVPNVISVMALSKNKTKWSLSNYGHKTVDIAAPGESIYSTGLKNNYRYASGTSMAAPYVAGAAALLLAREKTVPLFPEQVKEMLMKTAKTYCFPVVKKCMSSEKTSRFCGLDLAKAVNALRKDIIRPPRQTDNSCKQ